MAALTIYLTNVGDPILGAGNQLTNALPSVEGSTNTKVGTSTGWGELVSQGIGSAWPAGGSEPSPSGFGWLWDVSTLENNYLLPGSWSPTVRLSAITTLTATINCRAYKRSAAGVYTLIAEASLAAQAISISTANYNLTAATGPAVSFGPGDKLYVDLLLNITVGSVNSNDTVTVYQNGGANEQVVTPGYQSFTGGPARVNVTKIRHPIIFAPVGPVLPKLSLPVRVAMPADASPLADRAAGGSAILLTGRVAVLAVAVAPTRPVVQRSNDDAILLLNAWSQGDGQVLGGQPSRGVTPPTLRTLQIVAPVDMASALLNLISQGDGLVLGGQPSRGVTPPTLRTVLFAAVPDRSSAILNPVCGGDGQIVGGLASAGVTAPTLRTVWVAAPVDESLASLNPLAQGDGQVLGGQPSRPVTPLTLRLVSIAAPVDESLAYSTTTQGYVLRQGGLPSRSVTPPILRSILLAAPTDESSSTLNSLAQGDSLILGGLPSVSVTPPTLRIALIAAPSDESPVMFSAQSRGAAQQLGGRPDRSITPPTLRTVLVIAPVDEMLATDPRGRGASDLLGGLPSAGVTPLTLRTVTIAMPVDESSVMLQPQARGDSILLGGKPIQPVTPPTLRTVLLAATDELVVVLSPQARGDTLQLGGKPSQAGALPLLRPVFMAAQADESFAHTPVARGYADLLGGPPSVQGPPPPAFPPLVVVRMIAPVDESTVVLDPRAYGRAQVLSVSQLPPAPVANIGIYEPIFVSPWGGLF